MLRAVTKAYTTYFSAPRMATSRIEPATTVHGLRHTAPYKTELLAHCYTHR